MSFTLDKPLKGDVFAIAYNDPSKLSEAIVRYQRRIKMPEPWCNVSHVGLVTMGGDKPQGVELAPPRGRWVDITGHYKDCRVYFMRYDFTGDATRRYDVIMAAVRNSYVKYDYLGVLHFVLGFLRPSMKRRWCSELVTQAFSDCGISLSELSPEEMTPADVCSSLLLKNMALIDL